MSGVYSGGAGWPLSQSLSIYGVPMGSKFLIDPPVDPRGRYNPGYGPQASTDARFIYDQSFNSRPGQYAHRTGLEGVYTMRGVLNGLGQEAPGSDISLCTTNCNAEFKRADRAGKCAAACRQAFDMPGKPCSAFCAAAGYTGTGAFSRRARCTNQCENARAGILMTEEGGAGAPLVEGTALATILPIVVVVGGGLLLLTLFLGRKKAKEVRANRRRRRTRRLRSYYR